MAKGYTASHLAHPSPSLSRTPMRQRCKVLPWNMFYHQGSLSLSLLLSFFLSLFLGSLSLSLSLLLSLSLSLSLSRLCMVEHDTPRCLSLSRPHEQGRNHKCSTSILPNRIVIKHVHASVTSPDHPATLSAAPSLCAHVRARARGGARGTSSMEVTLALSGHLAHRPPLPLSPHLFPPKCPTSTTP